MNKCVLLLAVLCSALSHADQVTLRADVWFPMNGEPGSANPGYMIEVADKAFAAAGHSIDYANMPWERAVAEVRAGKIDCAVGAYKEDAPDFVYGDQHLGLDTQAFFVKKGTPFRYTGNLEDLRNVSIGIIGGYSYGEDFDEFIKQPGLSVQSISADNALEQNIKKLLAGRIVTTLDSVPVVRAKIKEMGVQDQIVMAGQFGEPTPMYIACSPAKPTSKQYVAILDKGIRDLRASGELKKILDKYGLEDWQ
ncbi:substrate-binding periplasmic protein [Permianibacter aggregans]|uniref:Amino acid ABC transporter substrate-binding protein (PAAT family) n=1 Tax=Permianibacter aggregans TaxID=1510150 RepID=A0A4V3D877_9GAMM|nr:transporter substrate-binding domain-containing protein [Permianibacter aggregans]QGX38802.1 transporter substrate-binding domain-containing protein [Permianibacter aggregans]TDQ50607.1 amino acid ABC transporter substrate-binding protein (PAAT family) [Permianibacter aggregans]